MCQYINSFESNLGGSCQMISGRILLSKLWDFGGLYFCLFPPLLPPPTIYFHNKIIHTHTHIYNTFTEHQPPTYSNLLSFQINIFFFLLFLLFGIMSVVVAESKYHVLAVDDSLIDRKLIERLLKTSSYQGMYVV